MSSMSIVDTLTELNIKRADGKFVGVNLGAAICVVSESDVQYLVFRQTGYTAPFDLGSGDMTVTQGEVGTTLVEVKLLEPNVSAPNIDMMPVGTLAGKTYRLHYSNLPISIGLEKYGRTTRLPSGMIAIHGKERTIIKFKPSDVIRKPISFVAILGLTDDGSEESDSEKAERIAYEKTKANR